MGELTGKHSWNAEVVKKLTREAFIKQCEHLPAEEAGAEYDKIVGEKEEKKKEK